MARCKVCRDNFQPRFFLQKTCVKPECLAEWSKEDRKKPVTTTEKVKKIKHAKEKREYNENKRSNASELGKAHS